MADLFVLRHPLPGSSSDDCEWLLVDAAGVPQGAPARGTLVAAAAAAGSRRLIVIVPGEDVALSSPELPARGGARLAKLVPFALEEQLAADVETLHFAVGRQDAERRVPVAAVERARLTEWLARLMAAGLAPAAVYPDTMLAPDNPAHVVLVLDRGRLLLRRPGALPIALDAEPLSEALASAGLAPGPEQAGETAHVIVYATPAEWELHAPAIEALRESVASLKVQLLADGVLPLLAGAAVKAPWNLLQGEFAVHQGFAGDFARWRPAALAFGAFLALHLATLGLDYWRVHREEVKVNAELRQVAAEALPNIHNLDRLPSLRAAVESRLRGSRALLSEGLIGALGAYAAASQAAPGAQLTALSYRDGTTDLTVDAPNVGALDAMREAARGRGFNAELQGATQHDTRYQGRIQLKGPGR